MLPTKLQIEDQLKKYFQCELKLIVTACIITETESIGGPLVPVCQLLKKFLVHKCGHEKRPISGMACIRAMTKTCNYIVATQDRDLQEWILSRAGIPLFYLHNNQVPTLVQPSDASVKAAAKKLHSRVHVREVDEKTLINLKRKEGLVSESQTQPKRRKKVKNPNPLSCKKSKKKKNVTSSHEIPGVQSQSIETRKRKRIKLPKHVIEQHFKAGGVEGTV
ncbi:rRNA-processing protein UTP23 homolog isoform X2 [Wyeomyia smithii]|uniref:rRNA-processing protein UTP23 homolog isoform X2 n=1 Tax=Wyeomyia smithii TaxID=174621 RepID=UPI002467C722|nr:rRNA-processing protein UTP23 homolog isoform X2 [Wyeomyia smithii]